MKVEDIFNKFCPKKPRRSKAPVGKCSYCDNMREIKSSFHPPHDASPNCESGHKNHCSCDICF